jgi:hypothetical protein
MATTTDNPAGQAGGTRRVLAAGLAALLLATGITAGGYLIGRGFRESRAGERFVSVKGLAEREVKADLAVWPLRFVATSNNLAEAQAKIAADTGQIIAFFGASRIGRDAIEVRSLEVTDLLAQPFRSGPVESRFIVAQTLAIRSAEVDRIAQTSQRLGELVEAGVVLSTEGQQGPFYLFTRLNDVKPPMIAEATRNARAAAEQFAADSGSRIGGIRRASQGLFQILPRDEAPGADEAKQIDKRVRVVSTVDYSVVD